MLKIRQKGCVFLRLYRAKGPKEHEKVISGFIDWDFKILNKINNS